MRTHIIPALLLPLSILFFSCSRSLDEINTSKTKVNQEVFDPGLLLPSTMSSYSSGIGGYNGNLIFQGYWVQGIAAASTSSQYNAIGDKYVEEQTTLGRQGNAWDALYGAGSYAYELQRLAKDKPAYTNIRAAAKIMEILIVSTISDIYGDMPYTEAFQAKYGNLTRLVYNKQSELYPLLLRDLETAISSFSNTADKLSLKDYDPLYQGDITKWKKFGNSIMLRLAMRMSKVDNTSAKVWVEKAYNTGVFQEQSDEAVLKMDYDNGFGNSNASVLNTKLDFYYIRWSRPFIKNLKDGNDPRLKVISEIPPDGLIANYDTNQKVGDNTPSKQLGMPNGYEDVDKSILTSIQNEPLYPGPTGTLNYDDPSTPNVVEKLNNIALLGKYSRPTQIYRNNSSPVFMFTLYEVKFLLAEAKLRGFSVAESPSTLFQDAVKAAMKSLSAYGVEAVIADADVAQFTSKLPASPTIEDINTQFWISSCSTLSFVEAWNNWKRTGYPNLTPVTTFKTISVSNGEIPRRQRYPSNEASLNEKNFNAAVSNMGGNTWTTRVWWDR